MKETIKQKTVNRLHRRDSSSSSTASVDYSSGERLEFKFSGLQAIQVPRGWDKLSLSLISVETGKTIAKTGRTLARNGNCQWTETLTESIWVPHDDDASKELDQCLYKLLISMGSGRSGILGDVTVNLSGHLSSGSSISIAQPLKNCSYGTILQVEIQCLTPRANLRNDIWRDTDSFTEDTTASDYLENTSEVSDGRITKSVASSTSSNFLDMSQVGELGNRETSLFAGGSQRSFDSMDDSFSRESSSPRSSINLTEVTNNLIATNSALHSSYHAYDSPRSSHSSSGKVSNSIPASPLRTFSSEFVLEAEGATAEELRAEARKWERKARKLMVDLDFSKKESGEQTKNWENATMEIVALKHEINHLNALLDESKVKESANDGLKLQDKDDIHTELEEEMKFQKDLSDNLSLQLRKTQESNLELVSLLQELEETLEEKSQALLDNELAWTKKLSLKDKEIFNLEERLLETPNLNEEVKALKDRIQELERDCNELTDENLKLLFKTKESSKNQHCEVKEEVEKKEVDVMASDYLQIRCDELESKCMELEVKMQGFKDKACYLDGEVDKYRAKADEQENEIAAMRQVLKLRQDGKHENRLHKAQKIRTQRHPQRDMELSDLRILKNQLNGSLKVMQTETTIISECLEKVKTDMVALNNTKESQITANKTLQKKLLDLESSNHELELHLAELEQENLHLSERISGLEPQLRYLTDEKESSRLELQYSVTRVADLQAEIKTLQNEIEVIKIDTKQKSQEMQKRWLEAQEQCEYLKKANPKLQSTAENLIEECASLQKSNIELKQQRLELHNRCTDLESELSESKHNFSNLSRNFEDLEHKMTNEIAIKEKTKLDTVHDEYKARVLELTIELAASKQNHEKLMELFENTRSSEEKLRITVAELDRNLKYCEYERVQLTEEISSFKDQLQKLPLLNDEVVDLKNSLNEVRYEKERLEASLELIAVDYEELKEEKSLLTKKTSSMQKAVVELEEIKRNKIGLEEKVMRLQGDLTAREALCAQDAELKNEVGRLKRSNSSLKRRVNCLQEEKDELEEKLEQKQGLEQDEYDSNSFLSGGQDGDLEVNDETTKKEDDKDALSVEAELKELQERYLHMSLKYAEVEAQKEELLFKLKKSWFS